MSIKSTWFFLLFTVFSVNVSAESRAVTYDGDKKGFWIVADKQFFISVETKNFKVKSYTSVPPKFKSIKEKVFSNEKN